jgi:hypothetical protein
MSLGLAACRVLRSGQIDQAPNKLIISSPPRRAGFVFPSFFLVLAAKKSNLWRASVALSMPSDEATPVTDPKNASTACKTALIFKRRAVARLQTPWQRQIDHPKQCHRGAGSKSNRWTLILPGSK